MHPALGVGARLRVGDRGRGPRMSRNMGRWLLAGYAGVLVAGLVACGVRPPGREGGGEGPGGRDQPLVLTPEQELAVGRKAYREVMEEHRGSVLPKDSPEVARCRGITKALVKAAMIEPLQREIN